MMTEDRLSEAEIITRYFAPLAGEGGLRLLDDAAVVKPPAEHDLVITSDALVAGIHFFEDDLPTSIARKSLAVNVSDLAAKGAKPLGFTLTLALPDTCTPDWLASFSQGLGESAGQHRCPLLGGDTVRTKGPLTISITALGSVPTGTMVRRTTAKPGDLIGVTGTIGDAAIGLILRQRGYASWVTHLALHHRVHLTDRYLHPHPRLILIQALRTHASAAMDISDGLAGDARKLLQASQVGGVIDLDRIPLSQAVNAVLKLESTLFDKAVTGGDDYEVLFTVDPDRSEAFRQEAAKVGVGLTFIGKVVDEQAVTFTRKGKDYRFASEAYSHF